MAARHRAGVGFRLRQDLVLTMVQWSALTRMLRELVSNALATRVEITGVLQAGLLRLTLADDGIGRNPQNWSHGLGLGGVRKRVRLLRGEVQCTPTLIPDSSGISPARPGWRARCSRACIRSPAAARASCRTPQLPADQPGHRRAAPRHARADRSKRWSAGAAGPVGLPGHRRVNRRCAKPSPAGCSAATAWRWTRPPRCCR
jgi:hypothetical protein